MLSDNGENIIIENSKDMQFFCVFNVIVTPVLFIALYLDSHSIAQALFVTSPMFLGLIVGISEAKRITMDKDGCMVEIFFLNKFVVYEKKHKWDEFVLKRIVDVSKICREAKYGFPYEKAAFLTLTEMRIPRKWRPYTISIFHPFSFHYMYFKRYGVKNLSRMKSFTTYEVDETVFFEKMAEWGITFESSLE